MVLIRFARSELKNMTLDAPPLESSARRSKLTPYFCSRVMRARASSVVVSRGSLVLLPR